MCCQSAHQGPGTPVGPLWSLGIQIQCALRPEMGRRRRGGGVSSLRQRDEDLHVADGEEAGLAVHHALVPVVVDAVGEDDDVPLLKSQLALGLRLKGVQGATARLVQHLRLCLDRKQPMRSCPRPSCPH